MVPEECWTESKSRPNPRGPFSMTQCLWAGRPSTTSSEVADRLATESSRLVHRLATTCSEISSATTGKELSLSRCLSPASSPQKRTGDKPSCGIKQNKTKEIVGVKRVRVCRLTVYLCGHIQDLHNVSIPGTLEECMKTMQGSPHQQNTQIKDRHVFVRLHDWLLKMLFCMHYERNAYITPFHFNIVLYCCI